MTTTEEGDFNPFFSIPQIFKKFAKIGLSTTGGGGFKPDFCCAPRIFLAHSPFGHSPAMTLMSPEYTGFKDYRDLN
ncbi:MAG: hypothetical protein ACFCUM_17175 [Bacteroidales bacterium]